jgi:hypothetical protein
MTYNVSLSSSSYSVKIQSEPSFKVQVATEASSVAGNLSDLSDVDVSGVHDKYLIMYNASTQKYTAVNPDQVLSAATTETLSPGLPADFMNQMDIDLDNRIDLDAGTF